MVRVRYVPPRDRSAQVEKLRPAFDALSDWRLCYPPGSSVYWSIVEARDALNKVAKELNGEPLFTPPEAHSTPK